MVEKQFSRSRNGKRGQSIPHRAKRKWTEGVDTAPGAVWLGGSRSTSQRRDDAGSLGITSRSGSESRAAPVPQQRVGCCRQAWSSRNPL